MHINDPINGIKSQHLDPLLMTYFPAAKGVVLAYLNISIGDDNETLQDPRVTIAKIEGNSPFTFMWINVDLLVWSPQVGDVLEGDVYMQTAGHLGLLIGDTFNCSIRKYGIPESWQFVPVQEDEVVNEDEEQEGDKKFKNFGYWIDENEIKVEGKLKFTVKAIHTSGRVVSVDGTLIKPGEEKSAQPVARGSDIRRGSTSTVQAGGKHKKFDDDEEDNEPTVTVIPEPEAEDDDDTKLPAYIKASDDENEDEDGEVVNKDSDSEDEVESD